MNDAFEITDLKSAIGAYLRGYRWVARKTENSPRIAHYTRQDAVDYVGEAASPMDAVWSLEYEIVFRAFGCYPAMEHTLIDVSQFADLNAGELAVLGRITKEHLYNEYRLRE